MSAHVDRAAHVLRGIGFACDVAVLFSAWFATMRASLLVNVAQGAAPGSPAFVDAVVRTQRALAHTRDTEGLKRRLRACGLYTVDALATLAGGV